MWSPVQRGTVVIFMCLPTYSLRVALDPKGVNATFTRYWVEIMPEVFIFGCDPRGRLCTEVADRKFSKSFLSQQCSSTAIRARRL